MERAVFEIILEQREEEQKAGRNIATSQHLDIPTSRRRVKEKRKSTSGQRRNASTSRRLNVAMLQRRDVSVISASPSLKAKGTKNRLIGKRTDEGTESRAAANQISGEDSCFCIFFFPERLLMFYRLIMCITKSNMF